MSEWNTRIARLRVLMSSTLDPTLDPAKRVGIQAEIDRLVFAKFQQEVLQANDAAQPADPLFEKQHTTRLPYGGKSKVGHSEAGREQQEKDDAEGGATGQRQGSTMVLVGLAAERGMTIRELSEVAGWHHGQASSVLSTLHKSGDLVRLRERRKGQSVYVTPDFIAGREVSIRRNNPNVVQAAEPEIRYTERIVEIVRPRTLTRPHADALATLKGKISQSRDRGVLPMKVSTLDWLIGLIDDLQKGE